MDKQREIYALLGIANTVEQINSQIFVGENKQFYDSKKHAGTKKGVQLLLEDTNDEPGADKLPQIEDEILDPLSKRVEMIESSTYVSLTDIKHTKRGIRGINFN